MKLSEKQITKQIRDYLKIKNIFHWKVFQTLGSARGVADIIGIYKRQPLAIEIKNQKGKLSSQQRLFLMNFAENGGIVIVARSVEDVINGLKNNKIVL